MLDERSTIYRQPDFLAVISTSALALFHRYQFVPVVRIGIAANDTEVARLEFSDHLRADAHLELATIDACWSGVAVTLASDELGVFCISPQKGSIQDHAAKAVSVPIRISPNSRTISSTLTVPLAVYGTRSVPLECLYLIAFKDDETLARILHVTFSSAERSLIK
jgi:hypothetical protein